MNEQQENNEAPTAFDAIAARAAEIDKAAGVSPEQIESQERGPDAEPAAAVADYLGESRGAVDMMAALLVGFCPACETLWDADTKNRVAASLAPVMEYHGFTFGNAPPHLMLAIVAGPPVWASAKLISAHVAEKRQAAQQASEKQQANEARQEAASQGKEVFRPIRTGAPESPQVMVHPQMGLYQ